MIMSDNETYEQKKRRLEEDRKRLNKSALRGLRAGDPTNRRSNNGKGNNGESSSNAATRTNRVGNSSNRQGRAQRIEACKHYLHLVVASSSDIAESTSGAQSNEPVV